MTMIKTEQRSASARDGTVDCGGAAGILDLISEPPSSAVMTLASGRQYDLAVDSGGDRVVVRARNGQVLLRVTVTDSGPVLAFDSAEIELRSTRSLRLDAETMDISARHLCTRISGDVETHIAGSRHTRLDGVDHLEAHEVQVQANEGAVELRAAGRIALDGEHVGLNDDPCPRPFAWSAIADGPEPAVTEEKKGV